MKTYQEFVVEAKKCWPGYKKKGTQKLFGKTYNRCVKDVKEAKVDIGKTDAEKNELRNRRSGMDNYDRINVHIDQIGEKKKRGAKEDDFWKTKFTRDKSGKVTKYRDWHVSNPNDRRARIENEEIEPEGDYVEEVWSNEYKRSIDCDNPKGFSQKAHCAGRTKRKEGGKTKSKSPFQEMYEIELEESSTGERTRGRATLARGRGADMTKSERTTAAVAKKAGLKGTGKFSTKDLRKKGRDYTTYDSDDEEEDIGSTEQDHFIRTYSSPRRAAKGERLVSKMKSVTKPVVLRPGITGVTGRTAHQTSPSSESVRKVKDLKKQMTKSGANKRGRVHTVDIMHRDSNLGKNDPHQQMERGRNFKRALIDTPNQLKKAGAKKGETVIGKPTAVMPGEDRKKGEAKRARLYKNVFGKKSTKRSNVTGLMTGKVD